MCTNHPQNCPQTESGESTDVLLMGITGHGKSATGNSILGRQEFVSLGGTSSVTKDYHVGYKTVDGRTVKVVDVPGLNDTDAASAEAMLELVLEALTKAVARFPDGFHAVLLVVSYQERLTHEHRASIDFLVRLFDEEAFQRNGILVLTHGDAFRRDFGGSKSVQEWFEQAPSDQKWIYETCNRRCVLFDNATTDGSIVNDQLSQLLSEISEIKRRQPRYVPDVCKARDHDVLAERKTVRDVEHIKQLLGLLKEKIFTTLTTPKSQRRHWVEKLVQDAKYIKDVATHTCSGTAGDCSLTSDLEESLSTCIHAIIELLDPSTDNQLQNAVASVHKIISSIQTSIDKKTEKNPFWRSVFNKINAFFNSNTFQIISIVLRIVFKIIFK